MFEYVMSLLTNAIIFAGIGIVMVIIGHFVAKSNYAWANYRWAIYVWRVFIAIVFILSAAFTGYAIYGML